MSGFPGSVLTCRRKRKPSANKSRLTVISGLVSVLRMARILADRSVLDLLSTAAFCIQKKSDYFGSSVLRDFAGKVPTLGSTLS